MYNSENAGYTPPANGETTADREIGVSEKEPQPTVATPDGEEDAGLPQPIVLQENTENSGPPDNPTPKSKPLVINDPEEEAKPEEKRRIVSVGEVLPGWKSVPEVLPSDSSGEERRENHTYIKVGQTVPVNDQSPMPPLAPLLFVGGIAVAIGTPIVRGIKGQMDLRRFHKTR